MYMYNVCSNSNNLVEYVGLQFTAENIVVFLLHGHTYMYMYCTCNIIIHVHCNIILIHHHHLGMLVFFKDSLAKMK